MELYNYKAEVTRVVDGDTVDAFIDLGFDMHSKQRVRLYGINAPETRTRDLIEKKHGKAATRRLVEMLEENKSKLEQLGEQKVEVFESSTTRIERER